MIPKSGNRFSEKIMLKQKNLYGGIMPSKKSGAAAVGAAAVVALIAVATTPAMAADAAHGKVVFQTCAACHTDKPDAIGPSLRGVYGRKSAALPDFRYSNAMTRANLTWDDANLKAYIKDPQAKVKGNRMPFGGLSSDADIDDVVAYLKDYK
jgi:cytochrome c